ncbi:hypothetical protein DFQ30_010837 [Apophysomyces sp. BC1015]|nr:hypothetical protein DFQ30_010837 [Apophysomyces sp. BC1015]
MAICRGTNREKPYLNISGAPRSSAPAMRCVGARGTAPLDGSPRAIVPSPGACGKILDRFFGSQNIIMYQSDITQFLAQLKQQRPRLEEQQRDGRALLWDKASIDLDERTRLQKARNFNVLDIPMADVTAQYLGYVEQIRATNLELAAEYLLMAAMLIEIKSRMLLPVKKADTGEEAQDPRAELVRRLLEYEQMKLAAQQLDRLPQHGRDFLRAQVHIERSLAPRWPDVNADDLRGAWADVLKRAKLVQHHKITREALSVREHMSLVLRKLQNTRFMEFTELFDVSRGVPVVVVHFIAMLELCRESLLEITQAEPFAPIYVQLAYSPT